MNKDEALEIALEALELHGKQYPHMVKGYCLDAITAIKKALKTKDEPRTWVGLTDEEIESTYMDTMSFQQNAKALEAKLKEKNYDFPNKLQD
jgi:hypothetical protein